MTSIGCNKAGDWYQGSGVKGEIHLTSIASSTFVDSRLRSVRQRPRVVHRAVASVVTGSLLRRRCRRHRAAALAGAAAAVPLRRPPSRPRADPAAAGAAAVRRLLAPPRLLATTPCAPPPLVSTAPPRSDPRRAPAARHPPAFSLPVDQLPCVRRRWPSATSLRRPRRLSFSLSLRSS
ncbi:hypothetical protein Scep_026691 [Stephania cephalantha]|uniref:Uncharacterized protein n=1 Tax=Stephania cephalantha TaxID=152367 RepID=A0AAP0EQZ4_9MAGN